MLTSIWLWQIVIWEYFHTLRSLNLVHSDEICIYIYVIPSDQFDICFLFSYSPMWDHWSTTLTGWMIWYSAWMGETVSGEWEIWFCFQWNIGGNCKTQKLLLNKKGNRNEITECLSVRLKHPWKVAIYNIADTSLGPECIYMCLCLWTTKTPELQKPTKCGNLHIVPELYNIHTIIWMLASTAFVRLCATSFLSWGRERGYALL